MFAIKNQQDFFMPKWGYRRHMKTMKLTLCYNGSTYTMSYVAYSTRGVFESIAKSLILKSVFGYSFFKCCARKNRSGGFLRFPPSLGGHRQRRKSVLVLQVVYDGPGQVQLGNLALFNSLLVDILTNHTTAQVHQR